MRKETKETVLGAAVVVLAAFFVFTAFRGDDVSKGGSYEVTASFDNADGLGPGSEVRLVGVRVGTVLRQELDPKTYRAQVTMVIDDTVELTTDTSARVIPDGMTGANFVSIEPGGEEDLIQDGGSISYTQGAINFVDLLGRFVMTQEVPGEEDGGGEGLGGGLGMGLGTDLGTNLGTGLGTGLDETPDSSQ